MFTIELFERKAYRVQATAKSVPAMFDAVTRISTPGRVRVRNANTKVVLTGRIVLDDSAVRGYRFDRETAFGNAHPKRGR
jgi:hypothetical protein